MKKTLMLALQLIGGMSAGPVTADVTGVALTGRAGGRGAFPTALLLCLSLLSMGGEAKASEDEWSVAILGAVLTGDTLAETARLNADFDGSYTFLALALNRKLVHFNRHIDLEAEGQAVKHFGGRRHWEFNGVFIARWLTFPWDSYLDTSFAVGEGFSLSAETPEIEKRSHEETARLLNYLLFELAFSPPRSPGWEFVARIHHRSGVRGIINDVHGASNALAFGLRYSF